MKRPLRLTPVAVLAGIALGITVLVFGAGPQASGEDDLAKAVGDDDVLVVEVDPRADPSAEQERIRELVANDPTADIVLVLADGTPTPPGEERRLVDEARSAEELAARAAVEEAMRTQGLIIDLPPPCTQKPLVAEAAPHRFALCANTLVPLPSEVSAAGDTTDNLTVVDSLVAEMTRGVSVTEVENGYWSVFGNAPVEAVTRAVADGAVVVDFDGGLVEALGDSPSGWVSHSFLRQVYATVFQVGDVESVTLTLEGDCEAMGSLLATGCQTVDRALWSLMSEGSTASSPVDQGGDS